MSKQVIIYKTRFPEIPILIRKKLDDTAGGAHISELHIPIYEVYPKVARNTIKKLLNRMIDSGEIRKYPDFDDMRRTYYERKVIE